MDTRASTTERRVARDVDALGAVVLHELGAGVVGVELDLVYGGDNGGGGVGEELLKMCDLEVGDTDGADAAGGRELLHLLPGIDEGPVGDEGLVVGGGDGDGPMDEEKIEVLGVEVLERGADALLDFVEVSGVC